MIKRPYAPGKQGRSVNKSKLSDYGRQLAEKQKLRLWYNLSEKQFRRYISGVLNKPKKFKNPVEGLIQKLECRLDNVIYRSGWAESRIQARQLVVHGHFKVNNRSVDKPSFSVSQDDVIGIKDSHRNSALFKSLETKGKDRDKSITCPWLKMDHGKMESVFLRMPLVDEVNPPAQVSTILEFYTR